MRKYIVHYTSMVIEADSPEDAIERCEHGGGGNWEAVEVGPGFTPAEQDELWISYRLYVEGYDRDLDRRPALNFDSWVDFYAEDMLREARRAGRLPERWVR